MKTILKMQAGLFDELKAHLLPPGSTREEAAFLFATSQQLDGHINFQVIETIKLTSEEFDSQFNDYLELTDDTRARLIKRAHDLHASLVEMHSHPHPFPAAFSIADRMGLKETVPHMWWRLKKRPYLAIVVAPSGFDALVWLDNDRKPQRLDGVLDGQHLLHPTNNSLGGWQ
ncbi:MAG: Mov34/MPN/PAD-1 family protein [Nitrospira sp.]|nr:Mov34/MPN/PAD-1 family protein [Nitrospira sp.]